MVSSRPPKVRDKSVAGGFPLPFGKYLLERRLAVGGTSEVFLARPRLGTHPAPKVVIKRLLPAFLEDSASLGMFATEARLHKAVRHSNVVQVYEAGVIRNEPYLAIEYIEGVDTFQLLRRAQSERRPLPLGVAVYIARCISDALACVHATVDEAGASLGLVHRDVTPSNIYLSTDGDVRLGDFGIAREGSVSARSVCNSSNATLKGKYNYLSPEQVNGEPSDHRADLFSLGVVTAEMILGHPLFAGSGQLAVLLAIRDCRIEPLREIRDHLPAGLFSVLEQALQKEPEQRYQTARAFSEMLTPFEIPSRQAMKQQLSGCVLWARDTTDLPKQLDHALRESTNRFRAITPRSAMVDPIILAVPQITEPITPRTTVSSPPDSDARKTLEFDVLPSMIRRANGKMTGPVTFAHVIELLVTGNLSPDDEIDLMGEGFRKVKEIELLIRHLPESDVVRTSRVSIPPATGTAVTPAALLSLLGPLARNQETGLLLFEVAEGQGRPIRREVYVHQGVLLHIASTDASELLGQNLVRQGKLSAEELDMALAVLPRFDGRLGDTLIALGLIDAVELFQAIREQGRARFVRLFACTEGSVLFYEGVRPSRVEFPLDLELSQLLLDGLQVAFSDEQLQARHKGSLTKRLRSATPVSDLPLALRSTLPHGIRVLREAVGDDGPPMSVVVQRLAETHQLGPGDALRAVDVAVAMGLLLLEAR